jgi:hypothetical protein
MPEAFHSEDGSPARVLLLAREEVLGAQAVAHRADADANGVRPDAEERVEGDDLVDLPPADVHPIGDRVRELGRDRAGLAADAPEVVEQVSALGRELVEERGESENVDVVIIVEACAPS